MDELTKQYDAATKTPATPAAGAATGNSLTDSYNAAQATEQGVTSGGSSSQPGTGTPTAPADAGSYMPALSQPRPTVDTTPAAAGTAADDTAAAANPLAPSGANSTDNRVAAINQMYDAQQQARLNELQSAYDLSMSDLQAAADQINPNFQRQANDLAVQYERNRRNFNEGAILNGINTGAGAQADLARASEYQRDFGNLRTAQANQMAEAERQMANLTASYQTNIQTALANNDYQRAAALLDEYNNGYERDLKNAQILAEFGDFTGYAGLYGQEQADNMFAIWASQNPALAYMTGNITPDQYANLKGKKPMNEGLDENGVRIRRSSGGGGSARDLTGYGAGVPIDYSASKYPGISAATGGGTTTRVNPEAATYAARYGSGLTNSFG